MAGVASYKRFDCRARKIKASAVWRLWPKDSQHRAFHPYLLLVSRPFAVIVRTTAILPRRPPADAVASLSSNAASTFAAAG
jgi:hypothetical protein